MVPQLIVAHDAGLYCPAGDFFIDPWQPVPRAVITHAHSDHASAGSAHYLAADEGLPLLRLRLGNSAPISTLAVGEEISINGVRLSFHPAGHIWGAMQVRLEYAGQVWVVTGDYKLAADPTCSRFEVLRCHALITESTFGMPVFRWARAEAIAEAMNDWWRTNQAGGRASVIYGYAIGKAQRILASVDDTIGPIYTHGAVQHAADIYREHSVALPPTQAAVDLPRGTDWSRALIVAPPSAHGTPWLRRFGLITTAMASGWMQIRGIRRRRAVDRGFAFSDHVDWRGLLETIRATQAERVFVTHGYTGALVRFLQELGLEASAIATPFRGETVEGDAGDEPALEADAAGAKIDVDDKEADQQRELL